MNDELDPDLRRLFAATADYPADEDFVARVAAQTGRAPALLARSLKSALAAAAIIIAVAVGLGFALLQASDLLTGLADSLLGRATGLALAFAAAVCVRTLAPLARFGRL